MRRHLCAAFAAVLADDVRSVDRQATVRVDDDTEQARVRLRTHSKKNGTSTAVRHAIWHNAELDM